MSNTRKLKQFNRTSGTSQRSKLYWAGQPGNPTTRRRMAKQAEENAKPKFQLSHRKSADES